MAHNRHSARDQVITGAAIAGVFGTLLFIFRGGFPWAIFPMIFAGIIPMVKGLSRLSEERGQRGPSERKISSKKDAEKAILKIAYTHKGVVSPTIIAMETSLTIEDAEKYLGDLAGRGHASMNVRDNGSIEYIFNDLLPESEN